MTLETAISVDLQAVRDRYLLEKKWEDRTEDTIRWYGWRLDHFLRWLRVPLEDVQTSTLREYMDWCVTARHFKPATVTNTTQFLKTFFRWARSEGVTTVDPAAALKKPRLPKQFPYVFTVEQIRRLLKAPNQDSWDGFRNYVMMLVLLDTGMRRKEQIGLSLPDVDWTGMLLKVHGKGRKDRQVPIGKFAAKQLHRWIGVRGDVPFEDAVFINRRGDRLTGNAIAAMIRRYGRIAGIQGTRCSAHTFRHTFATRWILNGGDLFSLQAIMGHSDISTLEVYVHMAASQAKAQHARFSPVEHLLLS